MDKKFEHLIKEDIGYGTKMKNNSTSLVPQLDITTH